jgi:hypothetical protein
MVCGMTEEPFARVSHSRYPILLHATVKGFYIPIFDEEHAEYLLCGEKVGCAWFSLPRQTFRIPR